MLIHQKSMYWFDLPLQGLGLKNEINRTYCTSGTHITHIIPKVRDTWVGKLKLWTGSIPTGITETALLE